MTRKNFRADTGVADVIDFAARARCRSEARGLDPLAVAVTMLAETGSAPAWTDYSTDGWDDAA
ncbi:hypothetical protein BOX37_05225 [Nocardia mangyaensis]|uniref:Uncharacterized protein n=1 Tax=Nocardia mangyaensis TaxID=2213200 RepID=A0A1J0VN72_9NOCA|nr:hypothetical protein [Nocardia mangyaensis]APE33470.1 hypothetical protein BOX37_05225 [Nocardia mangyaensis]